VELLEDIRTFLLNVLRMWRAYPVAGLVVALLVIYGRIVRKAMSRRALVSGAVTFVTVAVFLGWREQYYFARSLEMEVVKARIKIAELDKPEFEIVRATSIIGDAITIRGNRRDRATQVLLPLDITNLGSASIIKGIKLSAQFKAGVNLEGSAFIPAEKDFILNMPEGPLKFSTSSNLLTLYIANPIPTGGMADGYVVYLFPPGIKTKLTEPSTTLILDVKDVTGKTYRVGIPMSEPLAARMSLPSDLRTNP